MIHTAYKSTATNRIFSYLGSASKCPGATRGMIARKLTPELRVSRIYLSCPRAITPIRAKPLIRGFAHILTVTLPLFFTILYSILLLQASGIIFRNYLLHCGPTAVGAGGGLIPQQIITLVRQGGNVKKKLRVTQGRHYMPFWNQWVFLCNSVARVSRDNISAGSLHARLLSYDRQPARGKHC